MLNPQPSYRVSNCLIFIKFWLNWMSMHPISDRTKYYFSEAVKWDKGFCTSFMKIWSNLSNLLQQGVHFEWSSQANMAYYKFAVVIMVICTFGPKQIFDFWFEYYFCNLHTDFKRYWIKNQTHKLCIFLYISLFSDF